jgi:hypothetical protein
MKFAIFYFILLSILLSPKLFAQSEDLITVNILDKSHEKYISLITRELALQINNFQQITKSFIEIPLTINIASDFEKYYYWQKNHNAIFENSIGFTDLENNTVYLRNPETISKDKKLISLLFHQYLHLYVYYHWKDAPLWFHESVASYFSEKLTLSYFMYFIFNYTFHKDYLLIKHANEYPDENENIEPYYFQAIYLMKKLLEEQNKIHILFENSNNENNFLQVFYQTYNKYPEEFLEEFQVQINEFYYRNINLGIIFLTWLSFPIILVIARIKLHKKNKEILEKWVKELYKENC